MTQAGRVGIVVSVALAALLTVALTQLFSNRTMQQQALRLELLAVVTEENSRAHLYLEEALAGDKSVSPEKDVYALWKDGRELLKTAARGGSCRLGTLRAAPDLEEELTGLSGTLEELEGLARQRMAGSDRPGTDSDARFDEVFTTAGVQAGKLTRRIRSNLDYAVRLGQSLTSVSCLVLLAALALVWWLGQRASREFLLQLANTREILSQVRRVTIQLTGVTNTVGASARQQQASVAEQASTATEILATSQEISATSRELARTVHDMASSADDTARVAGEGELLLREMQSNMTQIVEASNGIVARLATLSEKASNISSVLTTISKVAGQTNLLSLNAAIEAEKAGEYGRGFSVVASEIRRLADQTNVSSADIEHMVREVQSAVSAGVMGMDKFREEIRRSEQAVLHVVGQLRHIIGRVQGMVTHFENVNDGMRSQAQGAEQIADSIGQLSDAAQQTASGLRELNGVISQLQESTQLLQEAAGVEKRSAG